MRKIFDDIRVVENGVTRNPVYVSLSSLSLALVLMSLIAVATLIAALFPQGMEDSFYLAEFGERLFHVYESLGLLTVLRSWWFMVLFVLLFAALVVCTHARVTEGRYRGPSGTKLYETEFSVPKTSEEIVLIFPVLLSSIGFRKRRVIHDGKRTEVVAVRGVSAWMNSFLLHSSVGLLLVGLVLSYLFSWAGSLYLEEGRVSTLPAIRTATRWSTLRTGLLPGVASQDSSRELRLELLQFNEKYSPAPKGLVLPGAGKALPARSLTRTDIVRDQKGRTYVLGDWQSRVRVMRDAGSRVIRISTGKPQEAFGVSVTGGYFCNVATIEVAPGRDTFHVALPASVNVEGVSVRISESPRASAVNEMSTGTVAPVAADWIRFAVSPAESPLGYSPGSRAGLAPSQEGAGSETAGESTDAPVGREVRLAGLSLKAIDVRRASLVRIRSDPGRTPLRLGAFLLALFAMVRLYLYSYALRVEISALRGGSSRLRIRMRSSGLMASPPRIAGKIAGLLAK
jgi:hypothetical protein